MSLTHNLGTDTDKYSGQSRFEEKRLSRTIRANNLTPYVRYGFKEGNDFYQEYQLRRFDESPPDGAGFVSPGIYFLNDEEEERLSNGSPPKNIQGDCRRENRVIYSVVAESDAFTQGTPAPDIAEQLTEFISEWLGVDDYQLYFSGNRSLHIHARAFVTADGWGRLKKLAGQFNEETDAALDTSIYKTKAQFRLPGAKHDKSGLAKTPIDQDDDRREIVRKIEQADSIRKEEISYVARIPDTASLLHEIEGRMVSPYIKESPGLDDPITVKPFSPYALTGGGDRSVCIFRQTGEVFEHDETHYVPAYVLQAVGGDESFTRENSECKIQLSTPDARKWGFKEGEYGVIIGGRSRKSRLLSIDQDDATLLKQILEQQGRGPTLETLEHLGFDVGASCRITGNYNNTRNSTSFEKTHAAELQERAEQGDIDSELTHLQRLHVANRLLALHGWDGAWDWFREQYGDQFDPDLTRKFLRSVTTRFDDLPDSPC